MAGKDKEVQEAIAAVDGRCSIKAARAAIAAMRTMTPEMIQAACAVQRPVDGYPSTLGGLIAAEYDAAITAELKS